MKDTSFDYGLDAGPGYEMTYAERRVGPVAAGQRHRGIAERDAILARRLDLVTEGIPFCALQT